MKSLAVLIVLLWVLLSAPASVAQDMTLSGILSDGQGWELVAQGFKFTEGPAVDGKGNLFFTDIPNNRIHKLDAQGRLSVFAENTFGVNGLIFGPDGRLYGCQNGKKRIVAYDASGKESVITEDVESNDIVVNHKGAIYFTDPKNKQVWYISPDGKKRVVDTGIGSPNGIALWPDQGTLIVADTAGPNLWAFRIEADDSLAYKQPYYTMRMVEGQRGSGADGLRVDRAGRAYVATHAGVQVFDPTGRLIGVIQKPQKAWLANLVFGGPDLDTLYVTSADKVFRRKIKAKGVLYFQGPILMPGKK